MSHLDIGPVLKAFQSTLEARHVILPEVSKEFMAISQKIVDYTNEWCHGQSLTQDRRTNNAPDDIFIMNCPELHPVLGKVLLSSLEENCSTGMQQASLFSLRRPGIQCAPSSESALISTGSDFTSERRSFQDGLSSMLISTGCYLCT